MPLVKNDSIIAEISSVSSDGSGVARHDGQVVFVPAAAVGDKLRVKIVKAAKTHAFGRIEEILSPGAGRRQSDCPVSHRCGGCAFRHLSYEAELVAKQAFVQDALARIGGMDADVLPIRPSPAQNRYRNKVQYPVAADASGALAYGFFASRSHRVVPCENCLLQPEALNQIAAKAAALLREMGAAPYDETTRTGLVRHIYLRQGAHTGEVLLCLVLTGFDLPEKQRFKEEMCRAFPEIKTVVLNENAQNTNVICGEASQVLWGDGTIESRLCGVPVRLGVHTFAQVNTEGAEQLFEVVRELAQPDKSKTILDLYCGTGVIGLSMARACKALVGVEVVPSAVESAQKSAAQMGISNARFLCATAANAARQLCGEGFAPDIAVLDPPRKGAGDATLAALVEMGPLRIVMVSCNPATLARDLAMLAQRGYALRTVQPADLFPRTKHVECVALLEKKQ